jgi:hypothetical protein
VQTAVIYTDETRATALQEAQQRIEELEQRREQLMAVQSSQYASRKAPLHQ